MSRLFPSLPAYSLLNSTPVRAHTVGDRPVAKKKEAEGDGVSSELPAANQASAEPDENSENLKRAGGRTIARWKQQAFEDLPTGTDKEIAEYINQTAKEE